MRVTRVVREEIEMGNPTVFYVMCVVTALVLGWLGSYFYYKAGVSELEAERECPVCDRMIPVYLERRLSSHMRGDEPCVGSNIKVMGISGNKSQ